MRRLGVVLAAALVAASACGSPDATGRAAPGSSPDDPVSASAGPFTPATTPEPELREPEDGLVDVYARSFDRHEARGHTLTLIYYSGVKDCYGLDRIEAQESDRRVVVTIYEGRRPEAEICPEIAVQVRSEVELRAPLGDRKLVDGAR